MDSVDMLLSRDPLQLALALQNKENIGITYENGSTLLMVAVEDLNVQAVELILMAYDSVDYVNMQDYRGFTSLGIAAFWGQTEIAELLLRAGADPNIAEERGLTPMRHATNQKDMDMVKLLAKYGAID